MKKFGLDLATLRGVELEESTKRQYVNEGESLAGIYEVRFTKYELFPNEFREKG
jgi:hypothetical protein